MLVEPTASDEILLDAVSKRSVDRTDGICQGLREVRMIKDGKLKSKFADELLDEL